MRASPLVRMTALRLPLWRRVRTSHLARNTSWVLAGQAARVLLQLAYVVLITRALQAEGYGMFEAALALAFIVAPFSGWGTSQLLLMHLARDRREFAVRWGDVIAKTVVSAVILSLAMVIVARTVLPNVSPGLVLSLSIAIFFAQRISESAAQAYQAVEAMARAAVLAVLPYAIRLMVLGLVLLSSASLSSQAWGLWYLASSLLTAAIAFALVTRSLGMPAFDLPAIRRGIGDGAFFSLGGTSDALYADVDKALMARLSTLEATGIYAAAYRAVTTAFLPIRSLLYATYPRFFVHGRDGVSNSLAFARQVVPYSLGLGACASAALWMLSSLVPWLLGPSYQETKEAIRWLAPLPSIQALHYVAGDALSGAGHQRMRTLLQIGVMLGNVSLNLWLIPQHGWLGAAWATLLTEGTLAACFWIAAWRLAQSERSAPSA